MKSLITLIFITLLTLIGNSQIVVSYTISPQNPCVGDLVTFTSTSTTNGIAITNYSWDLGDGTTINGLNQTVTHTYSPTGIGSRTIILVINQNTPTEAHILIPPTITVNPNPTAQFIVSPSGCTLPVSTTFTNQSSTGSNMTYAWDFGNTATSTLQNPPNISFPTANTYTASLTVTNSTTGCKSSVSHNFTINDFKTDFTLADSICIGNSTVATDNSTSGANSWNWTINNVQKSVSQNPSLTFIDAGTFNVKLTATNTSNGCTASKTKQIVVVPKPILQFTANPTVGCAPLSVNFTNTTPKNSNSVWDFGDGTALGNGGIISHSYANNGKYHVKLTCAGVFGCTATRIDSSLILVTPPISSFLSAQPTGCADLPVHLNNFSTSPNPLDDPIVSYEWDFGNGKKSTLQTPPDSTYTNGLYDVSLKITTSKGCTVTTSKPKYIQVGTIDSVRFTYTPNDICAKSPVNFKSKVYIPNTIPFDSSEIKYIWDFGDSGSSSDKDPSYSYPIDTGYFKVKLTVDFRGCLDFFEIDSAVFVRAPIANFTPESNVYCNPASFPVNVKVNDSSKKGKLSDDIDLTWKWGDPLSSTTVFNNGTLDANNNSGNSSFNFQNYGTYTIWQVIHNVTTGCQDSISKNIIIDKVEAGFTLNNDTVCKNGLVSMSYDQTIIPTLPGSTFSYSWDITGVKKVNGTDTLLSGINASITHKIPGTHNIILTVTDNNACAQTAILPINVLELPIASFTPSSPGSCVGNNVVFTSTSSFPGTVHASSIASYDWTLPNNSHSFINPTNYTFNALGNFSVSLIVTDNFGCVSLVSDPFSYPITKPTPNFTVSSIICNKIPFSTTNSSSGTGNLNYNWYLDNSKISSSNQSTLNHTYSESNATTSKQHKVTLYATDGNGCIDSITKNITIAIPKADFKVVFSGAKLNPDGHTSTCPPVFGAYTNQSAVFGVQTYFSSWEFGDGKTSTLKDPNNTFLFANTYTGKLTITDQYGCIDDTVRIDYLTIGGPSIDIITNPIGSICDNLQFFDTINGKGVDHILWNFGDNTTGTTASVEHNYPTAGTYVPSLMIYDDQNCSVNYPMSPISFKTQLTAFYTTNPTIGKTEEPVTFVDQSLYSAPIVKWYWKYGDFDSTFLIDSVGNTGVFTYEFPYTYYTSLTVTDSNGCTSTYKLPLKVTGDFKAPNVFSPNGDGVNDKFIFFKDIFKSYNILILNRWDNVVYEKMNESGVAIWDGTNQNKEQCTEGVYFYKINGFLTDDTPFEKVGFVTKME